MSYTVMKKVESNGDVVKCSEFANSHGFGPRIWNALVKKYLEFKFGFPSPLDWDSLLEARRTKSLQLEVFEDLVLSLTYDRMVVKKEDFQTVVADLNIFADAHADPNHICHLKAIADQIKKLEGDPNVQGCCFHVTDIVEDPWLLDRETSEVYNLYQGTDHQFLEIEYDEEG